MALLKWDEADKRFYETGISQMTLYPMSNGAYGNGVAWNGVTAFTESPSGAEATAVYADNIKYLNLISAEEFGATIEAIQYPVEFNGCMGVAIPKPGVYISQQGHKSFGLSYKTNIGSNEDGDSHSYKIHLVYGAYAAPTEKAYATVNDSPENMTFSWTLTTTPVEVTGFKPIAHLEIDARYADPDKLKDFEEILWGRDADVEQGITALTASLPLPDDVKGYLTPDTTPDDPQEDEPGNG